MLSYEIFTNMNRGGLQGVRGSTVALPQHKILDLVGAFLQGIMWVQRITYSHC